MHILHECLLVGIITLVHLLIYQIHLQVLKEVKCEYTENKLWEFFRERSGTYFFVCPATLHMTLAQGQTTLVNYLCEVFVALKQTALKQIHIIHATTFTLLAPSLKKLKPCVLMKSSVQGHKALYHKVLCLNFEDFHKGWIFHSQKLFVENVKKTQA